MLALLVRWLFLYYGIIKMHQEKDKSNYYIDVNGNKKRKIGLSEKKLKQMSIEEIDVLERTGKYAMPLDYEEALENFRSNHFMKKSDNFRMFNYKNKLDGFNDKDIALGQVANLRAQQNIASQNNI